MDFRALIRPPDGRRSGAVTGGRIAGGSDVQESSRDSTFPSVGRDGLPRVVGESLELGPEPPPQLVVVMGPGAQDLHRVVEHDPVVVGRYVVLHDVPVRQHQVDDLDRAPERVGMAPGQHRLKRLVHRVACP
ncbi:MAG: hypothetical protein LC808_05695 [Actinobacteria bacterium]|nr:hypothetical protein [Actinomycetota bacterium]